MTSPVQVFPPSTKQDYGGNVAPPPNVATGSFTSPLTTKGDIHCYSTTDDRLPVGTNTQVLTALSSTSTGLIWKDSKSTGGFIRADQVIASGSPATVSLTIPAGYTDLVIKIVARDAANSGGLNQYMYFNADTTSGNYDNSQYSRVLNASGSVATVVSTAAGSFIGVGCGVLNNANAVAQYVIHVNNYAATVFQKTFTSLNAARYQTTPTRDALYVEGIWKSTAAITGVTFTAPSSTWVTGSTFTAYCGE